jgi:hypothetical protein
MQHSLSPPLSEYVVLLCRLRQPVPRRGRLWDITRIFVDENAGDADAKEEAMILMKLQSGLLDVLITRRSWLRASLRSGTDGQSMFT